MAENHKHYDNGGDNGALETGALLARRRMRKPSSEGFQREETSVGGCTGRLYRRNHPGGGDVPERSPVVVEDGTERIIRSRTAPKRRQTVMVCLLFGRCGIRQGLSHSRILYRS